MAELNIIEQANKVLTFRKYIREECRKKSMEYPADDKVSEWIKQGYGYNVEDFMKDYTEKEGIFRDPFNDFKAAIDKYTWAEKPTEEEMREYVTQNGYNVKGFLRQHTINKQQPLSKKVLLAVLEKCTIPQLVALWNDFVAESAMYGEDSYIYDLQDPQDVNDLRKGMMPEELKKVLSLKTRWVSWHNLNNGEIFGSTDEDIKSTIVAYWSDIYPRLITWHSCYDDLGRKGTEQRFDNFYDMVVWPIFCEKLGYEFNPMKGTLVEIEA